MRSLLPCFLQNSQVEFTTNSEPCQINEVVKTTLDFSQDSFLSRLKQYPDSPDNVQAKNLGNLPGE